MVKRNRADEALKFLQSDTVAVPESTDLKVETRLSNALAQLSAEVAEGNQESAADSIARIRELIEFASKSDGSVWLNEQRPQFEILQEHFLSQSNRSSL